MAKLTPNAQVPVAPTATPLPAPVRPAGHVTAVAPQPFAVVTPAQAKSAKNPRREGTAKVPRLTGEPWFQENFRIGHAEDVIQVRRYPDKRNGFHCPPCGIAGSNAIVIVGKDGKGEPIEIYETDPVTRQPRAIGTINGFMVGATCLRKYGKVDMAKINLGDARKFMEARGQQADQPVTEVQTEKAAEKFVEQSGEVVEEVKSEKA